MKLPDSYAEILGNVAEDVQNALASAIETSSGLSRLSRLFISYLAAFSTTTIGPESPLIYPSPYGQGQGQWAPAYAQAQHLVGQMTLGEKINVTRGFPSDNTCAGNTGSVPRLGWPGMCLHDAGNGVRATDFVNAYPSGIHVGASWDKDLTYLRGRHMGKEFKMKGVNVALGPSAGPLGRSPLGGRNWEGFSVDPYLSGQLSAATIKGMQEGGTIANIKHYIGNEQETYRRPYFGIEAVSSNIDDKTLHEYYLWPFMDSIKAGVASVMCSYNRVNNTYGCGNSKLMNGILKDELGFDGFVLLDWNAQHAVESANAGLDMVMPAAGAWGDSLTEAVLNGTIDEGRVTDMVTRIIAAWYLVGQDLPTFPEPGVGMQNLTRPHRPVDARDKASKPVLMDGAIAGHVLLKNSNNTLPFTEKRAMLSVFGYDAKPPPTKNTDRLFELGYTSSPEMNDAVLGTEQYFNQAALSGTIISGGRAAANAAPYIIDPLSAIQHRAVEDDTWVNWDTSSSNPDVNAASDACFVFVNAMATEGWDRDGLHDDFSDALILNVASKCANTIVIIHAAGIRLVDQWIDHPNITAVVLAHLPGQDSGRALVKLLYGEANFSGKLPYTMAKNESDYSVYEVCGRKPKDTKSPHCDFDEGVYLDYRHFDAKNITPRYEFGFGLSYTTYDYSDLSIHQKFSETSATTFKDNLWDMVGTLNATITNTGPAAGAEVAQLYMGIPNSPLKQLRGFDKVYLQQGETGNVAFNITRRDVSIWDVVLQKWRIQEGRHPVYVGASSRDIRLQGYLDFQ